MKIETLMPQSLIGFLSQILDLVVRAHGNGSRVDQDHRDRKELEPSAEDHSLKRRLEVTQSAGRLQDTLCVPVRAWSRICKGCQTPQTESFK